MEYQGKAYKVIIWDWLWTLYSPLKKDLYWWVREYFEKFGDESENFLVSFADNPERRKKLVSEMGADRWFREIYAEKYEDGKKGAFTDLMNAHGLSKDNILVVGDNVKEEIAAARNLDLSYMPIADWNEFITFKLGSRSEEGEQM